jgi:tripartite ATP-independent transporter DctP family solute receptor
MKKVLVITLAATLVFSLGACSKKTAGGASGTAEVIKFRYNGTLPDEHDTMKQIRKAAALMEERSNGRLIMQVFPNNTLTDSRGAIEGMQNNTIQAGEMATAPLAGFTSIFQPFNLPFFFANVDECTNYSKSDFFLKTLGDKMAKEIGLRPIGAFYNGPRSVSNSRREVKTPDDLKGLKVRVMESPVYIRTWEAWGAQPTPMSFAELFTGLQQKTIDGQDNGPTITVTNKLYEVQKYYSTIYYVFDLGPVMVSETFYQSLPDDLRTIFVESFNQVITEQHQIGKDSIENDLKTMESNGVTITRLTDEQRMAFKAAAQPVYDWFKGQYPQIDLNAYTAAIK